jgi:hypothetical protein
MSASSSQVRASNSPTSTTAAGNRNQSPLQQRQQQQGSSTNRSTNVVTPSRTPGNNASTRSPARNTASTRPTQGSLNPNAASARSRRVETHFSGSTSSGPGASSSNNNRRPSPGSYRSAMGASSIRSGSLRGGAASASQHAGDSRMRQEQMLKRTQKKMREIMKAEIKIRSDADQERQEFMDHVFKQFDEERESVIFKTINRLNGEVASLKVNLNTTERNWRNKWRKVVGTETAKLIDMLTSEGLIDAEKCPAGTIANFVNANDADAKNFEDLSTTLAFMSNNCYERVQNLKREQLNQQLRGDDLQSRLDNRSSELAAADRLIRTHLVGRGSEATIAVDLFRKQGVDFERRFENLEREFRARVEELLKDSASIEMVGSHNAEDAIMAKLKQNRALLLNPSTGGESVSSSSQQQQKLSFSEENSRKVEASKNWRPSGKNYVDILETFITSMECQKILQVQLLRDVQLAMIDLSKRHFTNITAEIRRNRSNLPASVRHKLFDEQTVTRDDLIEMLDILSFEPRVAEMIMGRFPPTELDDAAPELQRFLDSHENLEGDGASLAERKLKEKNQQQQTSNSSVAQTLASNKLSQMSIEGGDVRSAAAVDLTANIDRERNMRRQMMNLNNNNKNSAIEASSNQLGGRVLAFGAPTPHPAFQNPKRVNLPRKPFEYYSTKLVYNTKSGFSSVDDGTTTSSSPQQQERVRVDERGYVA